MKTSLALLFSLVLLLCSVFGAGAASGNALPELRSTLRMPFCSQTITVPSEEGLYVGRIFDQTVDYRADVTLNVDFGDYFSEYKGFLMFTIYDGSQLVAIGDYRAVQYTLKNVTNDHILYVKFDGILPALFSPDEIVIQCNLHVKTGFFDKIWGTVMSWFGLADATWDIYMGDNRR